MCGRYVLGADAADYAEFFGADRLATEALAPSYNVAPTDPVYVIAEWDRQRLMGTMRWGFIPHWAKDSKSVQINARGETAAGKPMFRESFAKRRCIIPADGFYEWEPKERGRTPHWVHRNDDSPLGFAGIWSTWKDPITGEVVRTCAIVTTAARGVIAGIHERMPVALDPSVWDAWLDRELTDPTEVESLLVPIDETWITEHEVEPAVNNVRNDHAGLTAPAGARRLP